VPYPQDDDGVCLLIKQEKKNIAIRAKRRDSFALVGPVWDWPVNQGKQEDFSNWSAMTFCALAAASGLLVARNSITLSKSFAASTERIIFRIALQVWEAGWT
jgi:hypothetical protein